MTVTINTDASFSHQKKTGGFGYWITSSKGRIKGGGMLENVRNSNDAESQAIANALHILSKSYLYSYKVTKLYVNTDSLSTIKQLKKKENPKFKAIEYIINIINNKFGGIKNVELRHVKAHSHTNTPRHYVNDWCDKEAKKWRHKLENK